MYLSFINYLPQPVSVMDVRNSFGSKNTNIIGHIHMYILNCLASNVSNMKAFKMQNVLHYIDISSILLHILGNRMSNSKVNSSVLSKM